MVLTQQGMQGMFSDFWRHFWPAPFGVRRASGIARMEARDAADALQYMGQSPLQSVQSKVSVASRLRSPVLGRLGKHVGEIDHICIKFIQLCKCLV